MAKCELLENCLFFNDKMANMPDAAERVKKYYCYNHQERCARFIMRKVINEVPKDLFPNELIKVSDRLGWKLSKQN